MIGQQRNALRRTSDRVESLLARALIVGFLLGAPLLAWSAGDATYRAEWRTEHWERAHLSQVAAVLVQQPGRFGAYGTETAAAQAARATWTGPDGSAHAGLVEVGVQAQAGEKARAGVGSRVAIWVDDSGRQHAPPGDHDPLGQAILTGVLVTLCLSTGLIGADRLGRAVLDRRRDQAWTREWLEVGPRWSGCR